VGETRHPDLVQMLFTSDSPLIRDTLFMYTADCKLYCTTAAIQIKGTVGFITITRS